VSDLRGERWCQRLVGLFQTLKRRQFSVDTRQLLAAQDLILLLAAEGRLPEQVGDLRTLLAPIFATSPQEQAQFYADFEDWLDEVGEPEPHPEPASPPPPRDPEIHRLRKRRQGWLLLMVLCLLGALGFAYQDNLQRLCQQFGWCAAPEPTSPITRLPPPPPNRPDSKFRFGETFRDTLLVQRKLETTDPNLPYRRAAFSIVPFLLVMILWLWRWYDRALWLEQRGSHVTPELQSLGLRHGERHLYRGTAARRDLQRLRLHRHLPSQELDVDATVEAVARRGGLFTPCYRERKVLPEYLVLVDQLAADDQRARLMEELVDSMRAAGLYVEDYVFFSDPRNLYGDAAGRSGLADLHRRYPDHRLIVLTDGSGFFHPYTGRPEPYLVDLARWPEAAILSPNLSAAWGLRERILIRRGFLVLPATPEGLAVLAHAATSAEDWGEALYVARVADKRPGPELPAPLRHTGQRWLAPEPPADTSPKALLRALRTYLGPETYAWLCACAVYPELAWRLTVVLGLELALREDRSPPDEADHLRLAGLPWFRHGYMPRWLRAWLVRDLPRGRRAVVRDLFADLLEAPAPGPGELQVARRRREPSGLWAGMRSAFERTRRFRALREAAPPESPLRDSVFATFLLGRTPRLIHFPLPQQLRRLIEAPDLGLVGPWTLGSVMTAVLLGAFLWRHYPEPAPQFVTERIDGPEMVVVPAGTFTMGSPQDEVGRYGHESQHEVNIVQPFALSTYEVTVGEFQRFVEVTGYRTEAERGEGCWVLTRMLRKWVLVVD
jgi:hypothetical protein